MFKNLLKVADEISNTSSLNFKIDADARGYIDKECPDTRCLFRFKIKAEEGSPAQHTEDLTCPMCGHRAPVGSWYTRDQIQQAKELAIKKIQGMLNSAMHDDARQFNKYQPRNAFLKMSMHVSGGSALANLDVPIAAAEAMELEVRCKECQTDFAVIGSAFFCPCCSHSSVDRVFDDALKKISAKKSCLNDIRAALEATAGKDQAAVLSRSLLESCLLDGVVAFQRFCEVSFRRLPGIKEPSFNVFQRLSEGGDLWRATVGKGYSDWLVEEDLQALSVLFQRRHLLAHSDGIVDGKYVAKTGDSTYVAGQRITVTAVDVETLVKALEKLAAGIRSSLSRTPS